MTDDERFSLIISLIGAVPLIGLPRDKRIPEDVTNMSAGRQEFRGSGSPANGALRREPTA